MFWIKVFLSLYVLIIFGMSIYRDKIEKNLLKYSKEENDNKSQELTREIKVNKNIEIIAILGLTVIVVIFGFFSMIVRTGEKEIGVMSVLGKPTAITTPGIHWGVPFLTERHIYDGTIKEMAIGYDLETDEADFDDCLMITKDLNYADIDFNIQYQITDPVEYCYGCREPELVLRNILQAAIKNVVGTHTIDETITTQRPVIESEVFDYATTELEEQHTGLTLVVVTVQDSNAPEGDDGKVKKAFTEVENQRQTAEGKKDEVKKYENTKIPEAQGKAEEIIQNAEAKKVERINQANQEVAKYLSVYEEYKHNPEIVKRKMYYEMMSGILKNPNMDIIIGEDKTIIIKDNSTENASSTDSAVEEEIVKSSEKEESSEKKKSSKNDK